MLRSKQYAEAARLWAAGMTGVEIARALGVDVKEVYYAAKNHRGDFARRYPRAPRVSEAEAMLIQAMRRHGMTLSQIMAETGRTKATVRRWAGRADVASA